MDISKKYYIIPVHKRCDWIFCWKESHSSGCKKKLYQSIYRYASILCFDTQQIYNKKNNLFVKLYIFLKLLLIISSLLQ